MTEFEQEVAELYREEALPKFGEHILQERGWDFVNTIISEFSVS